MHRPLFSAAIIAGWLVVALPAHAESGAALERARQLLAQNAGAAAATVLENALASASAAERPQILEQLERAYALAAQQAERAGNAQAAGFYRDNLAILARKRSRRPQAPPAEPPQPAALQTIPNTPLPNPTPPMTEPAQQPAPAPAPAATPPASAEPAAASIESSPLGDPPMEPATDIPAADAAFRAKRYDEAGRIYAALAKQNKLPASRKDHWAYCRCAEVVQRINAGPRSAAEWAAIQLEINKICELSPHNWFGEYLRSLAKERSSSARKDEPKDPKVIVRGASPEEPPRPQPQPRSSPPRQPAAAATVRAANVGNWQVLTTANFRILHGDSALAQEAAKIAEAARAEQMKRWTGSAPKGAWTPKCDIYLYPTSEIFSKMTGQPADSPGFSTMGLNAGQIIARRVNLRADHPNLLKAILPHEVTHVVLADLFPTQQIPRWADEGMAVLAEPADEQSTRANDLAGPLSNGQLFKLDDLMKMDYPDGKYWGLYYAQSVSLTRFLVEQGSPTQFITFLQTAQRGSDLEGTLRQVYQIDGFADLQRRWQTYARSTATVAAAPRPGQAATRRQ